MMEGFVCWKYYVDVLFYGVDDSVWFDVLLFSVSNRATE